MYTLERDREAGKNAVASNKNLKQTAYTVIKRKILSNELKPNEYLEEKKLCEMLSASRTPIREAINALELENLVTIIPNKGIFVTNISVQSIKELFQARLIMEPIVFHMAAANMDMDRMLDFRLQLEKAITEADYAEMNRLDYEFHNYITSECRNSFLIKAMNSISDNFQRVRTREFYSAERVTNGAREHIEMIDLFIGGQYEEFEKFLKTHISNTANFFYKSLV